MQRLLLSLELHDLVPVGGHLGLDAVGRLALYDDLGAERLLTLAVIMTASNTAIGNKRRRERTDKDKIPPSVGNERLFAWFIGSRRLASHWEAGPLNYATWVCLANSLIYVGGESLP